jgi:protein phosphatase
LQELAKRTEARLESLAKYREAYGHYCWPVKSIDNMKLAPFHLLATEGSVHTDKQHGWHKEKLTKLCAQDEKLLLATALQDCGRKRHYQLRSGGGVVAGSDFGRR